ncbi:ABC transporter permease [Candidatus Woesearchaeota archaeon]|nr:ABC transporter permease [Candidatus Woesearchaeota archaeon]
MIQDYFKIAFKSLKERRMRSWLTMIGIFIGIAAVVSLVSLGQGLQKTIDEQFELLGTDLILISPGGGFFGIGGATGELTDDDVHVVESVKGVELAGGMVSKLIRVEFKDEGKYVFVSGFNEEIEDLFESMSGLGVAEGRAFKASDRYKAQVGYLMGTGDIYEKPVKLRDTITIEGQDFSVIGIYSKIGNPQDDSNIYLPLETAKEVLKADDYMIIMARVHKGFDAQDVADAIEKKLRKSRNVEEGEEDFTIATSENLIETYDTVLNVVQAVVIGLASISLFVGGIGIMNTMYTAVLQRTNEIGVMKAIGAKNKDILQLFLIESGMLGLAGGGVGVIFGIAISQAVALGARAVQWEIIEASFPWYLIVGALAFSFVVGTVSGVLPAMQASKLKPVDALRYE